MIIWTEVISPRYQPLCKGGCLLDDFRDDRLITLQRHMGSRNQNRQDIVERLAILTEDLINDSVFYCACVIVRISDDFYDDRHENHLVEIRLK